MPLDSEMGAAPWYADADSAGDINWLRLVNC